MIRKLITIDEAACNGCGLCAAVCHEGAIGMAGGRATLLRDDYCDGLGDCLPVCPTGAISFAEREAAAYDAAAVKEHMARATQTVSQLRQWPVQIKLAPVHAPYFDGADLLIAADCTAYARADFHTRFMRNRATLIGCPKLDQVDYAEKLTELFRRNPIQSVTVARMEVPCCGGIAHAVQEALRDSGRAIPLQVVTISTDGNILKE
ncbi:MAG: 4Fe-4S binding protein [Oscillospiraceae bacterium]|nr:4Fe-4S binding protein [Oscillospiraceae bacterium]